MSSLDNAKPGKLVIRFAAEELHDIAPLTAQLEPKNDLMPISPPPPG